MKTVNIYIPKFDNSGKSLAKITQNVVESMCTTFGGCTQIPAVGSWFNDLNVLFNDEVTICQAAIPPNFAGLSTGDGIIKQLASYVLLNTDQEAVYITYTTGEAEIISK